MENFVGDAHSPGVQVVHLLSIPNVFIEISTLGNSRNRQDFNEYSCPPTHSPSNYTLNDATKAFKLKKHVILHKIKPTFIIQIH